jgi:hypothetical protein
MLPQGAIAGPALLQLGGRHARLFHARRIGFAGGGGGRIDLFQLVDRDRARVRIGAGEAAVEVGQVGPADLQLGDDHAHLQAPIAHMHVADHLVAGEDEQAPQRFADDGGAQMADMHGLGDVSAAVVHHHHLALLGGNAETLVVGDRVGVLAERSIGQRQVDEARAGQRDVAQLGQGLELRHHLLGDGARILLGGFGRGERAVALELAKVGTIGDRDTTVFCRQAKIAEHPRHDISERAA